MTPQQRRALVLINDGAWQVHDQANGTDHLREQLRRVNIAADIRVITETNPVHELVECALTEQFDLVVAVGGDGTVQQIATCLFDKPIPLGIIPLGTMNNIATSLGIPASLPDACAIIGTGQKRQIDGGLVNGQPFFEVVTIGPESDIAALAEATRHRGLRGMWEALTRGIEQVRHLRRYAVTIIADGQRKHQHVWAITICNTPLYGLHYAPARDAKIDDGRLDLIVLRHQNAWGYLRYWWRMIWGLSATDTRVTLQRVRTVQIRSREPLAVAISGFAIGMTPAKIQVVPGALTVLAPPAGDTALKTASPIASLLQSMAPATHHDTHEAASTTE